MPSSPEFRSVLLMSVGPIIDVDAWNPAHGGCDKRNIVQEACVAVLPVKQSLP